MNRKQGFTLIEIMLVLVLIGAILAVVIPRAWRANVDSKYSMVRQSAVQLSGYAQEWAQRQLETQDPDSTAILRNYFDTLIGTPGSSAGDPLYIYTATSNWTGDPEVVIGRGSSPYEATTAVVNDYIPPDVNFRNPFTGASLFGSFDVANPPPGSLAAGWATDATNGNRYYALIWQGQNGWFAGQGQDLAGLRNGVLLATLRP